MKIYFPSLNHPSTGVLKEAFTQNGFEVSNVVDQTVDTFMPIADSDIDRCLKMASKLTLPFTPPEKFSQLTDKGNTLLYQQYGIETPDSIIPTSLYDIESFPHDLVIMKKKHSYTKEQFPFSYKSMTKAELISKLPPNFFAHQTQGNPSNRYVLQQSLRTADALPVVVLSCGADSNGTLIPTRYSTAQYTNGEISNHKFTWTDTFTPQAQSVLDKLQQLVLNEGIRRCLFSVQLLEWNGELLLIDWNHRHTIPGMLMNFMVDPQSYSAFLRKVFDGTAEHFSFTGQWVCYRFYGDDTHFHRPELMAQYPNIRFIQGDDSRRPSYFTELEHEGEMNEFQAAFYSN